MDAVPPVAGRRVRRTRRRQRGQDPDEIETARLTGTPRGAARRCPTTSRSHSETIVERERSRSTLHARARPAATSSSSWPPTTATDLRAPVPRPVRFRRAHRRRSRSHSCAATAGVQLLRAVAGRVIDGGQLLQAIASGDDDAFVAASPLSAADRTAALTAAGRARGLVRPGLRRPRGAGRGRLGARLPRVPDVGIRRRRRRGPPDRARRRGVPPRPARLVLLRHPRRRARGGAARPGTGLGAAAPRS